MFFNFVYKKSQVKDFQPFKKSFDGYTETHIIIKITESTQRCSLLEKKPFQLLKKKEWKELTGGHTRTEESSQENRPWQAQIHDDSFYSRFPKPEKSSDGSPQIEKNQAESFFHNLFFAQKMKSCPVNENSPLL